MGIQIGTDIDSVESLAAVVGKELSRVERLSKRGFIQNGAAGAGGQSQLYVEGGQLKFFNANTKETKTITLS